MNKNGRRAFGCLVVALGGVGAACSVDTSDVHFVDDDVLRAEATGDTGATDGGAPDIGDGGVGAKPSKGGSTSKAGTSNGGTTSTAGKPASGGMPTGGTGMGPPLGGMPAGGTGGMLGCPLAKGDLRQPLIDDFDDGDAGLSMMAGRIGGWYVTNDGTRGAVQFPAQGTAMVKPDRPGYGDVGYALHTSGTGFTLWGAGIGASLLDPSGMAACRYDVSPYSGVRFYLKGVVVNDPAADNALHFHLVTSEVADLMHGGTCEPTPDNKCYDNFAYDITVVPTAWKQISIPFKSLKQAGWGEVVTLDLTHVLNLELTTGIDADFDYWIDAVEFY